MTAKEVLKILNQDGWSILCQDGSHIQLKHVTKKGRVTVPFHSGDIKVKTLHNILKQAGLK
jgi:predicted RNA binding protein YcfA (HicA-like mRNA interferase family)